MTGVFAHTKLFQQRLGQVLGYLAAAGAHPGGGVTGLPGRNAAKAVLADLKAAK